jgi:hypothetical protein
MLTRAIVPTIVTTHGQHVLTFLDIGRQVKATGHHTILAKAQMMSVQVEVGTLTHALELDKNFEL